MAKHASSKSPVAVPSSRELDNLWSRHNALWRETAQITSQWQDAALVEPDLLKHRVRGDFWDVIASKKITLIVGREYEHLLLGVSCSPKPSVSYMPIPHPSGVAVDHKTGVVHVASTRNPNQIYDLMPINAITQRLDVKAQTPPDKPLVPVRSRFFPGCLYMHDLAMIGDDLYANAVGQNAIIRIDPHGSYERVWWPKCVEEGGKPQFGLNYIQLNSIASGKSLKDSFFSASSAKISNRRPGHKNYPVDGRGVIFSAKTREPIASGLTRPHSARLAKVNNKEFLFVDNSGYGEFGFIEDSEFVTVTKLPGWTRGLSICGDIAFVGTSRVIPKFSQYAPGLDVNASICGIHAIDIKSGKVLGSMSWPWGNQIFAIDWLPVQQSAGFPFLASGQARDNRSLFYTFSTRSHNGSK
ncbi:MAG TPA: DUF4915 domain-containing protein [Oculatellaceae cyanobacterium]